MDEQMSLPPPVHGMLKEWTPRSGKKAGLRKGALLGILTSVELVGILGTMAEMQVDATTLITSPAHL